MESVMSDDARRDVVAGRGVGRNPYAFVLEAVRVQRPVVRRGDHF